MPTPDWPSLWEKEPGLRPRQCDDLPIPEVLGQEHGTDFWYWMSPKGSHHGSLSESTAAALCRDAAVRWLATHGGRLCFSGSSWYVDDHGDNAFVRGQASADAALFAACKAVLKDRAGAAT